MIFNLLCFKNKKNFFIIDPILQIQETLKPKSNWTDLKKQLI